MRTTEDYNFGKFGLYKTEDAYSKGSEMMKNASATMAARGPQIEKKEEESSFVENAAAMYKLGEATGINESIKESVIPSLKDFLKSPTPGDAAKTGEAGPMTEKLAGEIESAHSQFDASADSKAMTAQTKTPVQDFDAINKSDGMWNPQADNPIKGDPSMAKNPSQMMPNQNMPTNGMPTGPGQGVGAPQADVSKLTQNNPMDSIKAELTGDQDVGGAAGFGQDAKTMDPTAGSSPIGNAPGTGAGLEKGMENAIDTAGQEAMGTGADQAAQTGASALGDAASSLGGAGISGAIGAAAAGGDGEDIAGGAAQGVVTEGAKMGAEALMAEGGGAAAAEAAGAGAIEAGTGLAAEAAGTAAAAAAAEGTAAAATTAAATTAATAGTSAVAGGATAGATAGSVVPGIGTAIGAVVGVVAGGIASMFA